MDRVRPRPRPHEVVRHPLEPRIVNPSVQEEPAFSGAIRANVCKTWRSTRYVSDAVIAASMGGKR
jgi:hypothetical protein